MPLAPFNSGEEVHLRCQPYIQDAGAYWYVGSISRNDTRHVKVGLYKFLRETVIVNMLIGNGRQAWTHKFIEWLLAMPCFTDEHLAREDMALYLLRMISPDETRPPVLLLRVVCRLCLQSVEYKMERDDVFRQEVHSIQLARAQRS
jgi:hypothetical protein